MDIECIGTKRLISLMVGKRHKEFREQCVSSNVTLVIKCTPFTSFGEMETWHNPRLDIFKNGKQAYPSATEGKKLADICKKMTERYGVKYRFERKDNEQRTKEN